VQRRERDDTVWASVPGVPCAGGRVCRGKAAGGPHGKQQRGAPGGRSVHPAGIPQGGVGRPGEGRATVRHDGEIIAVGQGKAKVKLTLAAGQTYDVEVQAADGKIHRSMLSVK